MRTFGCEFEFRKARFVDVKKELLSRSFYKKLVVSNDFKKQVTTTGKVHHLKYDMSVSEKINKQWCGGEIATATFNAITDDTWHDIREIITSLKRANAVFSGETGLHVHVDVSDIDRMKLFALWYVYEQEIYKLFGNMRNGGFFTSLLYNDIHQIRIMTPQQKIGEILKTNKIEQLFGNKNTFLRFYEKKDLIICEFRVGEMCGDYNYCIGWIKLMLSLVEESTKHRDMLSIFWKVKSGALRSNLKDLCKQNIPLTKDEEVALFGDQKI